eukprot:1158597-Pelagomonas_calceolata.AAC.4
MSHKRHEATSLTAPKRNDAVNAPIRKEGMEAGPATCHDRHEASQGRAYLVRRVAAGALHDTHHHFDHHVQLAVDARHPLICSLDAQARLLVAAGTRTPCIQGR